MKRLWTLPAAALVALPLLTACTPTDEHTDQPVPQYRSNTGETFSEITVDGCQYLGFQLGMRSGGFTHKGNCLNPVHYGKVYVTPNPDFRPE